ncbi:MAG: GNAT family N-acetyltransferase [Gemmatimonadota bacterium]|nr:MAG: GNAT family N-acetyltransferase [Gemmatimonadota bacterium]
MHGNLPGLHDLYDTAEKRLVAALYQLESQNPMEPHNFAADEQLRDGTQLHIRAIRPDDKQALVDLFERLSPQTIYYRFHGVKKSLSRDELVYLTELDFHRRAALVAVLHIDGEDQIVGVGRYASAPNAPQHRAEVALTVEDAHQGRGIGSLLLKHLMQVARAEGITELDAFVLAENRHMLRLFERTGLVLQRSAAAGACHLVMTTDTPPSASALSPGGRHPAP